MKALTVHPWTLTAFFHSGEGYDLKWRVLSTEPEFKAVPVGGKSSPI